MPEKIFVCANYLDDCDVNKFIVVHILKTGTMMIAARGKDKTEANNERKYYLSRIQRGSLNKNTPKRPLSVCGGDPQSTLSSHTSRRQCGKENGDESIGALPRTRPKHC